MPDSSEYFYKWDFHFWDENYIGEKNSKKERAGEGTIEWHFGILKIQVNMILKIN